MSERNNIRLIREGRGWSQEHLGSLVGLTKFQLSRLEAGETKLSIDAARKIARALGVTLADLVGEDEAKPSPGFSDEVVPYTLKADDPLAALQRGSLYLYSADTDALDKAGFPRGAVLQIDDSQTTVARVLQGRDVHAVRVRLHPPEDFMKPVSLLRQFVPPRLLITNSSKGNLPSIDMDEADAHIVGVVVGVYRRL